MRDRLCLVSASSRPPRLPCLVSASSRPPRLPVPAGRWLTDARFPVPVGRWFDWCNVIADGSTPPEWVAMDLFSQAEHDELAQSILLCPDAAYIDRVQGEIDRLLPQMDRREIIAKSLNGRGALIQTSSMKEACEISNRVAPEHLEISSQEPHQWEPLLVHAGAIFMGAYTSESLGDYCAGPNHVLPTSGTARFSSPLGVYDFQKRSSLIEVSRVGAQLLGSIASVLARGEGLQAHALAAEMRLDSKDPDSKSNDKSSEKSSGGSLK